MRFLPLRTWWNRLRSNYWFIPTAIIGLAFGLAYGMLSLDASLPARYILHLSWIYTRDAAGARALLSVTSQSMITVAGVVFSITTVALTFASNQFGTRVLRNFIHDVGNQTVFGIFLGTFIYGLLVMRRVEGTDNGFLPSLSVAVGIFLAVGSTFTLVYFIHHVIVSLEAETVVARIAADLHSTVEFLFPEQLGVDKDKAQLEAESLPTEPPPDFDERSCLLNSTDEGFISQVDSDRLLKLTVKHDLVARIVLRPGDFVFEKAPLAQVWPKERVNENVLKEIRGTFDIQRQRTYEQDVGFVLQQLVLLTTRSLSPAINALGTAMDSIDRIAAALVLLGNRKIPSAYRYDEKKNLRVIAQPWSLELLTDEALNPLRQAASQQPVVIGHMLGILGRAMHHVANQELQSRLRAHLKLLEQASRQFPQTIDRALAERAFSEAVREGPAA